MKPVRKLPPRKILVLPLGDIVFFPGCVTHVVLKKSGFRQKTMAKALASDRMLLVVAERGLTATNVRPKDIFRMGTVGRIREIETRPDGLSRVRVDGVQRGRVLRAAKTKGILTATIQPISQRPGKLSSAACQALKELLDLFFERYLEYSEAAGAPDSYMWHCAIDPKGHTEAWCDLIAGNLGPLIEKKTKQKILETVSPVQRIKLLRDVLREKVNQLEADPILQNKVKAQRRREREQEREQARQAQMNREAAMASKLENLKENIARMLRSPNSGAKSSVKKTVELPMMPVRDLVVVPGTRVPFVVGRESSILALNEALATDKRIFLATQRDAQVDKPEPHEIYRIGTIANIIQNLKLPDDNIKIVVEGLQVAKVLRTDTSQEYFRATVETGSQFGDLPPETVSALADTWELVRDHSLDIAEQQRLLEMLDTADPLTYIRQAIELIAPAKGSQVVHKP